MKLSCCFALLLFIGVPSLAQSRPTNRTGPLVIVGGGGTPSAVLDRALSLAGGKDKARVLVFAQASRLPDSGEKNRLMWAGRGAKNIGVADLGKSQKTLIALKNCDLIWFSGGSQNRLMTALRKANLLDAIRAANTRGAVVGGTSAGAAVMSTQMMTGQAATKAVLVNATELAAGLGLALNTIVDQHFHARRRFNRLLSAVAQNPLCLGLGIDERTAVIWRSREGRLEVLGEGSVAILDAKGASRRGETGKPLHVFGLRFHNLVSGDQFALATRELLSPTPAKEDPTKSPSGKSKKI
ncbi:MAG: cyanophycinase [Planctomycetota bacterium]